MVTRLSNFFLRTLRDDPAGAEVASHKLLIRAGYIRPLAAGIFAWLPLGLRVKPRSRTSSARRWRPPVRRKCTSRRSCRGAREATGRWDEYGDLLFRLQGSQGRRLPPRSHAHEEAFTALVKSAYSSYRALH